MSLAIRSGGQNRRYRCCGVEAGCSHAHNGWQRDLGTTRAAVGLEAAHFSDLTDAELDALAAWVDRETEAGLRRATRLLRWAESLAAREGVGL